MAYGVNAPFGLRPISSINGGSWTEKTNEYYISASADGATTYASNVFTGDPVIFNPAAANQGGGTIARYGFNTDGDAGTNNVSVVGVFAGCRYTDINGKLVQSAYWPASTRVQAGTQIIAFVIDDPSVVYDIQVSTWTDELNDARFTYNMVGRNFGLGLGGGGANLAPNNPVDGNTRTGEYGVFLATTFTANNIDYTTATLPLKVIGYTLEPDNLNKPIGYTQDATTSPFLNVRVMINNHAFKAGTLGIVAA